MLDFDLSDIGSLGTDSPWRVRVWVAVTCLVLGALSGGLIGNWLGATTFAAIKGAAIGGAIAGGFGFVFPLLVLMGAAAALVIALVVGWQSLTGG